MQGLARGVAAAGGTHKPSLDRRGPIQASSGHLLSKLASAFFDVSTCGLVLAEGEGAVVAANPMARGLVAWETHLAEARCCNLFGCRVPNGPLDGECLTERTMADGRLSDLVVRLPEGGSARTALVNSARVADAHVLFELRPTEPRAAPGRQMPASGRIAAFTLGRVGLEDDRGSIGGEWLEHRPGQLLKLLITERHRVVHVEEIANALWGSVAPLGPGNVRQCVYAVRRRLDADRPRRGTGSVIIAHRGGYSIDRRRLRVDCDEFEARLGRGLAAFRAEDHTLARQELSTGMSLYRGEFLADEPYASWAFAERSRLAGMAGQGLRALAAIAARVHDYEDAARHLERLARMDEYDVEVQRSLIAVCLVRGRRSEAKRRYTALRARLREDFGEDPGFDLADMSLLKPQLGQLLAL